MTTLKLGYTNPLTDTFGAHPVLGGPLDLNDGTTFVLVSPEGLELAPPPRTLVPAGNIRTQGERATRALYRHNREATARVLLGPGLAAGATYAQFVAQVRTLLAWLNAPPAVPITLQYQPFSAAAPVYLDVVGCAHDLPTDEDMWLRMQLEPIELVFICRPGLRGDRIILDNLASNPGFEQGSGPVVQAFNDTFANANAYAVIAGTAPTVTANVMTIPSGGQVAFGSPAWAALSAWQVRVKWVTGLLAIFYLHYTDANNYLSVRFDGVNMTLHHAVAGTAHQLGSVAAALTNGNFYWLQATQFPTSPSTPTNGNPPDVQAQLFNDNAGAIGTSVAVAGPFATFDSVTALAGRPQIAASGAALAIGGAFAGVHTVSLFGPGAWGFNGALAGTAICSGAWEQASANTYPGGPVQSFGAGRIDAPQAGTWNARWNLFTDGASPVGTPAMPVGAAGDVVQVAAWVKSSGLSANASLQLIVAEADANGNHLRTTTVATLTGNQGFWTQMAGSLVTGASCAYVDLRLNALDTSVAGESANASVWWDNAQVWDQTTTKAGAGAMPYCELRFPQSPATLVVSGLLGDLPSPAHLSFGTYLASWAAGSKLTYALGRRAAASASFVGAAPSVGFFGTTFTPQGTAVLDLTSYGGYYVKATVTSANGWNPRGLSPKASDALGTYHVLARYRTADGSPALVQVRAKTEELLDPWYADVNTQKSIGTYFGPYVNPLSAANVWTVADAGQVQIPPFLRGALRDDSQVFEVPRGEWVGSTAGGAEGDASWLALLPVDGSLVAGVINNPSNSFLTIVTSWLWTYLDGLLVNRAGSGPGGQQDGPGWTYSIEGAPLAAPSHGGGGPGTQNTGFINVNNGADPYLTLDPSVQIAGQSGGINQVVGYVSDQAGDVLPMHAQIAYSPLYLWPR